MSRKPVVVGDVVVCTLMGDGPDGQFPYYINGVVVKLHDDYLMVATSCGRLREMKIAIDRDRVLTLDQIEALRKRFPSDE